MMTQAAPQLVVVEDDEIDAEALRRAFRARGVEYPLQVIPDGWSALTELRSGIGEGDSKVIVLDLNMPLMNGIELLQEMRADENLMHLPVFVMTTSSDPRDRVAAEAYDVVGFYIKDGSKEGLLAFVDDIVHKCKELLSE